ncbi:MAG: ribosome biogenesis GTPase Der, partial [Phycisphaerales bacterium]|nr:ribosome biogenesis GTPase Der [Phycisphaerales bacterium]
MNHIRGAMSSLDEDRSSVARRSLTPLALNCPVIPKIAIVGRPNVGKSSIMNMLAGRKVSITDDTPGTTRDRVTSEIVLEPEPGDQRSPIVCELIDTGGYGVYVAAGRRFDDAGMDLASLTKDIEGQIAKAVHNADLILFVIDTQAGVTALDETVARLLRQGGVGAIDDKGRTNAPVGSKVIVVANKPDGPKWEPHAMEAAALGFGEPLMCSAKNNYMRREFSERLFDAAHPIAKRLKREAAGRPADVPEMKLAIVGKRNAGKSSLVNTLAGEQRVIVSEIAGTTRDAVDVRFDMGGRKLLAIDTAGLRRKKSFADRIEWWALERMEKAIDRCDVALLMIDATEPISHVDHQVAAKLIRTYKPCAIVVNKWDLVRGKQVAGGKKGDKVTPEHYEAYLRENLKGLWYAPIAFISAKNNVNVKQTIDLAFEMMEQSSARVTTGKLNRVARAVIDSHKPSSKTGLHAKVYFEEGRWHLRDFGLNGTKVDGDRVSGAVELDDGDEIRIGEVTLRFVTRLKPGTQVHPPVEVPHTPPGGKTGRGSTVESLHNITKVHEV